MSTKKAATTTHGRPRSTPPTGPRRSATSRSSVTPARARPRSSRHCSPATGTSSRAGTIAEGTTVSDHDPVEVAQQRSVGLSVCPLRWDNVVVNLLDTPGYPDFTGELRAGLRAADAALFVVSAADDIDPITVSLWEECAALGTPRAVVVTKLDAPRRDARRDGRGLPARLRRRGRPGSPAAVPDRRRGEQPGGARRTAHPAPSTTTRRVSRRRSHPPTPPSRPTATSRPSARPSSRRSSTTARTRRCWSATWPARRSAWTSSSTTSRPRSRAARSTPCCRCAPRPDSGWASCSRCSPAASRRRSSSDPPAARSARRFRRAGAELRPGRAVARRGRPHHGRPLPRPAVPAADLLRDDHGRHRRAHLRPRRRATAGTPTTTRTSGSGRSTRRSARHCAPSSAPSPATSARSAGSAWPRPATRSRPRAHHC